MSTFPINEAEITGLFVESVLFGIHLISFGSCMQALVIPTSDMRWTLKKPGNVTWAMLVISVFLLTNAAFDVSLGFYHNLKAFVFFKGSGGPIEEFTNISDWINVSKSLTVVIQTMVGDAMLIYRCWVVYDGFWRVVAFSILLWAGCFASTVWVIFLEATLHSRVLVSAKQLQPAGTMFWGLTVSLNIITTGLLVWRIWSVDRENKSSRIEIPGESHGYRSRLDMIMRILIGSGLLYTTTAFMSFVTFVVGSNAVYVTTDAEIQVVGIAFNLIIIRTSRVFGQEGNAHGERHTSRTMSFRVNRSATLMDSETPTQYSLSRLDGDKGSTYDRDTGAFSK